MRDAVLFAPLKKLARTWNWGTVYGHLEGIASAVT